jgi:hypothetical protein
MIQDIIFEGSPSLTVICSNFGSGHLVDLSLLCGRISGLYENNIKNTRQEGTRYPKLFILNI